MILTLLQRLFRRYVYVVIANEEEKVKECVVLTSLSEAQNLYHRLQGIYGGANVCLYSRRVNETPYLLRVTTGD